MKGIMLYIPNGKTFAVVSGLPLAKFAKAAGDRKLTTYCSDGLVLFQYETEEGPYLFVASAQENGEEK